MKEELNQSKFQSDSKTKSNSKSDFLIRTGESTYTQG